jgi:hypothetical protein
MIYAFGIILGVSTPLLKLRKFNKLIIPCILKKKSLHINITKIWELLINLNLIGLKNPLKAQKSTVSDNLTRPSSNELSLEEERSLHKLILGEESDPLRLNLKEKLSYISDLVLPTPLSV